MDGFGPFERTVKMMDVKATTQKITDGYEKKTITVDAGHGVKVTGEGPFTATTDGKTITIKTTGRTRVLHVTQPSFIAHPQYYIDGKEYMACWTDYPNNGWGRYDNTWLIGLAVPEGTHELTVKEMVFPQGWTRSFTPLIENAVVQ